MNILLPVWMKGLEAISDEIRNMAKFVKESWAFMKEHKKSWLLPSVATYHPSRASHARITRRDLIRSAGHQVISRIGYWLMLFFVTLLSGCGGKDEATTGAGDPVNTSVLRVHESNPRWLTDDSGEAKYFTGPTGQFDVNPNATVSTVQDLWSDGVTGTNDYATAFDTVTANGHNFVRLWRWETSAWGSRHQFDTSTYWRVPTTQMPWTRRSTRSDSSTGSDITVGVYDLSSFNQSYFDRLRAVVLAAVEKGLTPSVMLFEGFENVSAAFSGFAHPMFKSNNVNGVSCDANSNALCEETHTLADAIITSYQDAYVQKVIDTLNDIDGYIYEIVNEAGADSVTWQDHVAGVISAHELQGGRQRHPIWMSPWYEGERHYPSNDYLYNNTRVQIVGPKTVAEREDFVRTPPANQANNSANVWFNDSDHEGVVTVDWPWKAFTRGLSPLYLDCPFAVCGREPDSIRPLIKTAMAQVLAYANRVNLKAMTVETGTSIIDSGYGLYETCAEYLMFMPVDGTNIINLESCSPATSFTVEFFEPLTGTTASGGIVAGGAKRSFNPAGSNPMVIYLKSTPTS